MSICLTAADTPADTPAKSPPPHAAAPRRPTRRPTRPQSRRRPTPPPHAAADTPADTPAKSPPPHAAAPRRPTRRPTRPQSRHRPTPPPTRRPTRPQSRRRPTPPPHTGRHAWRPEHAPVRVLVERSRASCPREPLGGSAAGAPAPAGRRVRGTGRGVTALRGLRYGRGLRGCASTLARPRAARARNGSARLHAGRGPQGGLPSL